LHPHTKLIPEADIYRLVMRSKLPSAVQFQDWVVEEVLPLDPRYRWQDRQLLHAASALAV